MFFFQNGWKILNLLAPHFYDLTQFFPEHAAKCFIEVLKEKHTDFVDSTSKQLTSDMVIKIIKMISKIILNKNVFF